MGNLLSEQLTKFVVHLTHICVVPVCGDGAPDAKEPAVPVGASNRKEKYLYLICSSTGSLQHSNSVV